MISNRILEGLEESLNQKRELFVKSIRRQETAKRAQSTRRSNQQLLIDNLRSQLFHQLHNLTLSSQFSSVPTQLSAIYDMVYKSAFRNQLVQNQDLKAAVRKLSRLVTESQQLDSSIRQDFCIMAQRLILLFISLDKDVQLDQTLVLCAISGFLHSNLELSVAGYQLLQMMTTYVPGGREFILSILQPGDFITMNARPDLDFKNNYFRFLLLIFCNNTNSPSVQQFTTMVDMVRSEIFKFSNCPGIINQLIRLLYLVLQSLGSQETNTGYPSHKVLDLMLDILINKKSFHPLSCETQFYVLQEIEVVLKMNATRLSNVVSPILVKEMLVATLSIQEQSRSLAWKILCSLTECSWFYKTFLDSKSHNIVYFQLDKINYLKYPLLFIIRVLPSLPQESQSISEFTRRKAMQTVVELLRFLEQDNVSLVQTQLLTLLSVGTFFNQFQTCNGVCQVVSQYGNMYDTSKELYGLAEQILRLNGNLYDSQNYWQPDQSI